MEVNQGQDIMDDKDCPVLLLSNLLYCIKSIQVLKPVSIVHECGQGCSLRKRRRIERQEMETSSLVHWHDFKNNKMFVLNMYCMKYTY